MSFLNACFFPPPILQELRQLPAQRQLRRCEIVVAGLFFMPKLIVTKSEPASFHKERIQKTLTVDLVIYSK